MLAFLIGSNNFFLFAKFNMLKLSAGMGAGMVKSGCQTCMF